MKENFRELTGTKVLITGSTGYIGSNLLRRLKDLDCKIFAPIPVLFEISAALFSLLCCSPT